MDLEVADKVKKSLTIRVTGNSETEEIEAVSLGPIVLGAALPIPHRHDVENIVGGVRKRFGRETPVIINPREFRNFVRCWIRSNLERLNPNSDVSFEHWLSETNYPAWRKDELRIAYAKLLEEGVGPWCFRNKMHVKQEFYPEWKWCRLINARVDSAKVLFGPYIKAIEHEVYNLPYFIKKVPVQLRPKFIDDMFFGYKNYYSSDYTAFESHMTTEMLNICELQLYSYMLSDVVGGEDVVKHLHTALAGRNKCYSRLVDVEVDGTRMSGDMCTSLGNGFTNLMAISYIMWKHGQAQEDFKVLVEGDDSLIGTNIELTVKDFQDVGLTVKITNRFDSVNLASFCSYVFSSNLENIVDPIRTLVKTGWTISQRKFGKCKVLKGLLRAKVDSLICEAPCCPIVKHFIRYLDRELRNVKAIYDWDWWSNLVRSRDATFMDECRRKLYLPVDYRDRLVMQEVFNISIGDQESMESYFDNLSGLEPMKVPFIENYLPISWVENWDFHVRVLKN